MIVGTSRGGPDESIVALEPTSSFTPTDAAVALTVLFASGFARRLFPTGSAGNVAQQLLEASLLGVYLASRSRLGARTVFGNRPNVRLILTGVGAGLALWVLIVTSGLIERVITEFNHPIYPIWTLVTPLAEISLATIFSGVVAAPLIEEVTFRSVMFQGLRSKFPVWVAAISVSLLFAAVHFGGIWTISDTLWAFLVSLTAIGLTLRTRSLWPAIALHATVNAITFLVGLILFRLIGYGIVMS